MKGKYRKAYMKMALAIAETSTSTVRKVGALLVHPEEGVISEGVNGMPPGWPTEECEYPCYDPKLVEERRARGRAIYTEQDSNGKEVSWCWKTKDECRHAEVAALEKLWVKKADAKGAWLFVTASPCLPCAIKIKTAQISKVIYLEDYDAVSGIPYLEKQGVVCEKIHSHELSEINHTINNNTTYNTL